MPMWGRLLSKADFRVFNVARAAHLGKFYHYDGEL